MSVSPRINPNGGRNLWCPIGMSNVNNSIIANAADRLAVRFVPDKNITLHRIILPFNLEGVDTDEVGAPAPVEIRPGSGHTPDPRTGYGNGNGGTIRVEIFACKADGTPLTTGGPLGQESVNAVQRYKESKTEFGITGTTRTQLFYFDVDDVACTKGVPYVAMISNTHASPAANFFSVNSPVAHELAAPAHNRMLPGKNVRGTAGLDPREAVLWSINSGGKWYVGKYVGGDSVSQGINPGRTHVSGYYNGFDSGSPDDAVRLPWYGYQETSGGPIKAAQPYYAYGGTSAAPLRCRSAPAATTLRRAGGYTSEGNNIGVITVTNVTTGQVRTTTYLKGCMQDGPLNAPLTVNAGDEILIDPQGPVFKAEADSFITSTFDVGGSTTEYPWTTDGFGSDVSQVWVDPWPNYLPQTRPGIAMSRGPTGSMWGPDSNPQTGRPTLTGDQWSRAEGSQKAQACDFVNSIGIVHHPEYTAFDPGTPLDSAIKRIQELKIRHVRAGLYSPANHSGVVDYQNPSQIFGQKIQQANATRAVGVQPISTLYGTTGEPKYNAAHNGSAYTITPENGTWARPLDGPAGYVSQSFWSGTGEWYDGELKQSAGDYRLVGWGGVGGLSGPNEPDNARETYWNGEGSVREVLEHKMDAKQARTDKIVLGGEQYVDWNTGRLTPGPAYAPQLPVIGVHIVNITNSSNMGDYTDGDGVDFGCDHRYWGGFLPKTVPTTFGMGYAGANDGSDWSKWSHWNGRLSPGGLATRSVPMCETENGYIMMPHQDNAGGQRYVPPEVGGLYINRIVHQNYNTGFKRTYVYRLTMENAEPVPFPARPDIGGNQRPAMGILKSDFSYTPAFHQLANLTNVIGWGQGSPGTAIPDVTLTTPYTRGPDDVTGGGDNNAQNKDQIYKTVLMQSDTKAIVMLHRNRMLWNRVLQRYVRVADVRSPEFAVPEGWQATGICEPDKNPIKDPDDGQVYANPKDGRKFAAPGTAGNGFTYNAGTNRMTVRLAGLMRLVQLEKIADPAPNNPPKILIETPITRTTTLRPRITGYAGIRAEDSNNVHAQVIRLSDSHIMWESDIAVVQPTNPLQSVFTMQINVDLAFGQQYALAVTQDSTLGDGSYLAPFLVAASESGPWAPEDSYQQWVLNAFRPWLDWGERWNVKLWLSEFGWPGDKHNAGDGLLWAKTLEGVYDLCRAYGVNTLQFGASQVFTDDDTPELDYENAIWHGPGAGSPLDSMLPPAEPLKLAAQDPDTIHGACITGLSFGWNDPAYNNSVPGTKGVNWFDEQPGTYVFAKNTGGVDVARIDVAWERLQPTLNGALDVTTNYGGGEPVGHLNILKEQVQFAEDAGQKVVLLLSGEGRYKQAGGTRVMGDGTLTTAHFADVWSKLSAQFKDNDTVIAYELVNEAHDLVGGLATHKTMTQAGVTAIRANADDKLILVPGYFWQGVVGWPDLHVDGPWILDIYDNHAYSGHYYGDTSSSPGTVSEFGTNDSVYEIPYSTALADTAGTLSLDYPQITISSPSNFASYTASQPVVITGVADADAGMSTTVDVVVYKDSKEVDANAATRSGTGFTTTFNGLDGGTYTFRAFQVNTANDAIGMTAPQAFNVLGSFDIGGIVSKAVHASVQWFRAVSTVISRSIHAGVQDEVEPEPEPPEEPPEEQLYINIKPIDPDGISPANNIASDQAVGHTMKWNDGSVFVVAQNTTGASHTITFETPGKIDDDLEIDDKVITVPAGQTRICGPFPPEIYNRADGTARFYVSGDNVMNLRIYHI